MPVSKRITSPNVINIIKEVNERLETNKTLPSKSQQSLAISDDYRPKISNKSSEEEVIIYKNLKTNNKFKGG